MTTEEFSNGFDTLVNSYRRFKAFDKQEVVDSIEFNEYEKSLFLTKAQQELVIDFYNGKNPYRDSFEGTEELRRYLDSLVRTKSYSTDDRVTETIGVSDNSVIYKLPEDLAFITLEQIIVSKYTFNKYLIKYLSKPEPIVLEDMPNELSIEGVRVKTECKLNPILHDTILDNAVRLALISKGIGIKQ